MKIYPVGVAVTVSIPLIDYNGDPVSPTGLSARVLDEKGDELLAPVDLTQDVPDTDVEMVVPGTVNALEVGLSMGARTVELTIETAGGAFTASETYMIRQVRRFSVPFNSFQTFEQAAILAHAMPDLSGWHAAGDEERRVALFEAATRLKRIGYFVRDTDWTDMMSRITPLNGPVRISPFMWADIDAQFFQSLPARFVTALSRAQVREANEILRGEEVKDRRNQGLMAQSTGESSMMFRPGKPLELPVSHKALQELSGYVEFRLTTTRA